MLEQIKPFFSLVGVILIIVAAYWVTYFIAKKGNRRFTKGRSIKVLDGFSLTKDNALYIIEVTGKVYLIAMTPGGATVIGELDRDTVLSDIPEGSESTMSFDKFKDSFSAVAKQKFSGSKGKSKSSDTDFSEYMKKSSKKNTEPWDKPSQDNLTNIFGSEKSSQDEEPGEVDKD